MAYNANVPFKNNIVATTAPISTDDSSKGYIAGSVWVDITNDISYVCLDNTTSTAIWNRTSGTVFEDVVVFMGHLVFDLEDEVIDTL